MARVRKNPNRGRPVTRAARQQELKIDSGSNRPPSPPPPCTSQNIQGSVEHACWPSGRCASAALFRPWLLLPPFSSIIFLPLCKVHALHIVHKSTSSWLPVCRQLFFLNLPTISVFVPVILLPLKAVLSLCLSLKFFLSLSSRANRNSR
jgi:hypothetical protein